MPIPTNAIALMLERFSPAVGMRFRRLENALRRRERLERQRHGSLRFRWSERREHGDDAAFVLVRALQAVPQMIR